MKSFCKQQFFVTLPLPSAAQINTSHIGGIILVDNACGAMPVTPLTGGVRVIKACITVRNNTVINASTGKCE